MMRMDRREALKAAVGAIVGTGCASIAVGEIVRKDAVVSKEQRDRLWGDFGDSMVGRQDANGVRLISLGFDENADGSFVAHMAFKRQQHVDWSEYL